MKRMNFPGRKYQRRMKVIEKLEQIPAEKQTTTEKYILKNLYAKTNMSFAQAINIQTKKFGGKTGRKASQVVIL